MLILTHLAAFSLGAAVIIALARYVAARELAQRPRPLARRRLAIRKANADQLPVIGDDLSDRLVAELNAIVNQE